MRREWLQVALVVAVVLALVAVEGVFRCAVQIDSRPTDAGAAIRECWRPTGRWEVWADIWASKEGDWQRVAEAPDLDSCIRFGNGLGVGRWGCEMESERVECEP